MTKSKKRELLGLMPTWLVEFYTWLLVTGTLLVIGHLLGGY